jgi:MFS family permease
VLGIALFSISAGLLLVTLFAGRLVDRFGSAWVTRVAGICMALSLISPALAGGLGPLMAALFVFGASAGAFDVGMNANGILAGGSADPDRPGHGLARVVGMSSAGRRAHAARRLRPRTAK